MAKKKRGYGDNDEPNLFTSSGLENFLSTPEEATIYREDPRDDKDIPETITGDWRRNRLRNYVINSEGAIKGAWEIYKTATERDAIAALTLICKIEQELSKLFDYESILIQQRNPEEDLNLIINKIAQDNDIRNEKLKILSLLSDQLIERLKAKGKTEQEIDELIEKKCTWLWRTIERHLDERFVREIRNKHDNIEY